MDERLDLEVRRRARGLCEYCRMPQTASQFRHVADHIIAPQHGGDTTEKNLALCCGRCNLHKGPNIAGIDPASGVLTRLFPSSSGRVG
jgi:5-methylcytosine-specific restriction endonuclease McrA